jgi:hypothetical protein
LTDQRGFDRITDLPQFPNAGDGADVGAFEHLGPTAAAVSINGRVLRADGLPIGGASLTISGGGLASPVTVRTGSFGRYSFAGLRAGETYIVQAAAGRHAFAEPARTIQLADSVSNLDFIAQPD